MEELIDKEIELRPVGCGPPRLIRERHARVSARPLGWLRLHAARLAESSTRSPSFFSHNPDPTSLPYAIQSQLGLEAIHPGRSGILDAFATVYDTGGTDEARRKAPGVRDDCRRR